jgi:hypothetical protein
VVTVERLISEAEEARMAAMENRQFSAAISAISLKRSWPDYGLKSAKT